MSRRRREEGLSGVLRRGDLGVLGLGVVLLLGAWSLRSSALGRTQRYVGHGVSFELPAHWAVIEGPAAGTLPPASARLIDAMATATYQPRIVVRDERVPDIVKHHEHLADYVIFNMRRDLTLFHLGKQRWTTVKTKGSGKKRALRLEYSYAKNPAAVSADPAPDTDVPVVIRAVSLVIMDGRRVRRVAVLQTAAQRGEDPALSARVIQSLVIGAAK